VVELAGSPGVLKRCNFGIIPNCKNIIGCDKRVSDELFDREKEENTLDADYLVVLQADEGMALVPESRSDKKPGRVRKPLPKANAQIPPELSPSHIAPACEPIPRGPAIYNDSKESTGRKRDILKASLEKSPIYKLGARITSGKKTNNATLAFPGEHNESSKLSSAPEMESSAIKSATNPDTSQADLAQLTASSIANTDGLATDIDAAERGIIVSPGSRMERSSNAPETSPVVEPDDSTKFLDTEVHSEDEMGSIPLQVPPISTPDQSADAVAKTAPQIRAASEQLMQIKALVLEQGYGFLKKLPTDARTEDYVARMLEEYRILLQKYSELSGKLQQATERLEGYMEIEMKLRETEAKLRVEKGKVFDAEKRRGRYDTESTQQKGKLARMERKRNEQLAKQEAKWQKEREALMERIKELRFSHEQQTQGIHDEHADKVKQLQKEQQDMHQRITEMGKQHTKRWYDLQNEKETVVRDLKQQIVRLKSELTREKGLSEERLRLQKESLDEEHEHDLDEHDDYLADLKKDHETQMTDLVKAHAQQMQQLQHRLQSEKVLLDKKRDEELARLRSQREELKVALVVRDHFKGLKDRELTARYKRISTEIENFASMEWNTRYEANWPLSESQLLRLHPKNTRKLKQQIVQHSMWVLLYEHIFSLPFQVFGKEGVPMNKDWTKIYASGKRHIVVNRSSS